MGGPTALTLVGAPPTPGDVEMNTGRALGDDPVPLTRGYR